jgi:A/G-specific adenine glycosylase
LLRWYDANRRRLPWRALPGETPDPYRVWLSEIMLQQTTVAAVGPYFHSFLRRWPTMTALAAAPVEDVMSAWAGLGYYSRARNLHACAERVAQEHGGRLPADESDLRKLPGIGPYTAAAITAIAFDKRAAPVDGNIERDQDAAAESEARIEGDCRNARARKPGGRLRASDDGPRRHDLRAEIARLRQLSVVGRLRRPRPRPRGKPARA